MKNKNHNTVTAFWQNILLEADLYCIARKFRKIIKMPINGFSFQKDWEDWRARNMKDSNDWESRRIKNAHAFIKEVKNKYPYYKIIITNVHFNVILLEFYYFNYVHDDTLNKYQFSGFEVSIIKDGLRIGCTDKVDDGVYIKIGQQSSVDSIVKFINTHKPLIKSCQDVFSHISRLNDCLMNKRLRIHKNFNNDQFTSFLNTFSKKELEKLGVVGAYKEDLICQIVRKNGHRRATSNSVKIAIQRQRKMHKAMYETK